MFRAMAIKEFREIQGIALLALAVHLIVVTSSSATGLAPWANEPRNIPFVNTDYVFSFSWIAVAFAVALGFRQTVRESIRGTWLLLLHRPMRRGRVIAVKLLVGASVYLVVSAVPILLYWWWAATPGTHASPFESSMTARMWHVWSLSSIAYFGAFLSGIRPGRWFGTRLLPLAGAGLLAGCVFAAMYWWWCAGAVLLTVIVTLLISNILFVAQERDYS